MKKNVYKNVVFIVDPSNLFVSLNIISACASNIRITQKSESFYCLLLFRSHFSLCVVFFSSLFSLSMFTVHSSLLPCRPPLNQSDLPIVLRPRSRNSICVRASIVHSLDFFSFFSWKKLPPHFLTDNRSIYFRFFCVVVEKRFFPLACIYIWR